MSDTPDGRNDTERKLVIWQQNLNKSSDAQLDLLHRLYPDQFDIVATQEPHINFLGNAQATTHWITVYPTGHLDRKERTRALIMINRMSISSNAWTQLEIDSPDVVGVEITGEQGTLRLLNIYNNCDDDSAMEAVDRYMGRANRRGVTAPLRYVWLGDFNRHSPLWDEDRNAHLFTRQNLEAADRLLSTTAKYGMQMVLPAGIPTLQAMATGNFTRVDNVFCDENSVGTFEYCNTEPAQRPVKTDHLPIISKIRMTTERNTFQSRYNFQKVDWENFGKKLKERLDTIEPPRELEDRQQAVERLKEVDTMIWRTIRYCVEMTNPCPHSKRWWTPALTKTRKVVKRLGRAAQRVRGLTDHPDHARYKSARNVYATELREAKARHWATWLADLDEDSVWTASKLAMGPSSDGGAARVPTLQVKDPITKEVTDTARDNESKAAMFHPLFFPPGPEVSSAPAEYEYPEPKWQYSTVTDEQIDRAIRKLKPKKGTKPSTIPNCVFRNAREILVPYLGPIFRATDNLGWYPEEWKMTETPVIRKPGKTDYTVPGAWRPVVLSDGYARLLNKCKTEDVVSNCERKGILPANHFGGRPGRSTTDSVHLLIQMVKDAWRKGLVVSVLFLDVKGAFPSVDIKRLVHNLRARGVPREHTEWMMRRLEGRQTTLTFDDFRSTMLAIDSGIDQGDPLSVITYLLYNACFLECLRQEHGERGALFVDDAYVLITGVDFGDTHRKIELIMERPGGVFDWARDHNCEFGVDKFQLLDLTRRLIPHPSLPRCKAQMPRPTMVLRGHMVESRACATFLGVRIDRELRWKEQGAKAVAKGQEWVARMGRLARVSRGVATPHLRRLYIAVALPRMMYAADIFLNPGPRRKTKNNQVTRGSRAVVGKLRTIQRKAAILITGAMGSTATDILDAHANLLPMEIMIDKFRCRAALRLATVPRSHPLFPYVRKAARRLVKRHPTPIHQLMHDFRINPEEVEKVEPTKMDPKWIPPYTVRVAKTREEAIKMDEDDAAAVQVYTDGSGKDGMIGAAAVLFRNGRKRRSLRLLMGTDKEHTVPEAEGVGLVMGLDLIRQESAVGRASMSADNVSSISRAASTAAAPAQYIWEMFHDRWKMTKNKHRRLRLTIRWVPGHEGVRGNEEADRLAKLAIEEGSSDRAKIPAPLRKKLPRSKAALWRTAKGELEKRAQKVWGDSPRHRKMAKVDAKMPSKGYLKLVEELPRRKASLLFQLRSGHVPLRAHLYRITRAEAPNCEKCHGAVESVHHYLMVCPGYAKERRVMAREGGRDTRMMGKLLSSAKMLPHLFRFVARTGRFKDTLGDLEEVI
jgi:ribonuclease HI